MPIPTRFGPCLARDARNLTKNHQETRREDLAGHGTALVVISGSSSWCNWVPCIFGYANLGKVLTHLTKLAPGRGIAKFSNQRLLAEHCQTVAYLRSLLPLASLQTLSNPDLRSRQLFHLFWRPRSRMLFFFSIAIPRQVLCTICVCVCVTLWYKRRAIPLQYLEITYIFALHNLNTV